MSNHLMIQENPFDVLGMEPTFDVDLSMLDAHYFTRQTQVHPDRFVYHSEPERTAASTQAALLNRAYETVKNPTLRAKALLKLRGIHFPEVEADTLQDPEILEEVMRFQENLQQAASPQDLTRLETQIQAQFTDVAKPFSEAFQTTQDHLLLKLALRLTYLSKLKEDIKVRHQQSSQKVL